jgi:hypothetical protein
MKRPAAPPLKYRGVTPADRRASTLPIRAVPLAEEYPSMENLECFGIWSAETQGLDSLAYWDA